MNGFQIMADSYHMAAEQGQISKEEANKKCKAYDYLANCDQEDIYNLFDSSAFNDICKSYLRKAADQLEGEGVLDEEQNAKICRRMNLLFSETTAKEVCEGR